MADGMVRAASRWCAALAGGGAQVGGGRTRTVRVTDTVGSGGHIWLSGLSDGG